MATAPAKTNKPTHTSFFERCIKPPSKQLRTVLAQRALSYGLSHKFITR
jgi:hypothetical protein